MDNTILLVDDDADDRMFFNDAVHAINANIICIAKTNGREAIDYLDSSVKLPAAIFLDLNMPLMNGFDFLKILMAQRYANIPVVMFTTSDKEADKQKSLAMGAKDFLTKPEHVTDLERKILKALKNVWPGSPLLN